MTAMAALRRSRRSFVAGLALAAPAVVRGQQSAAAIPEKLLREHAVPGLSVAMARNGKMVFQQGFG
jgi:CubicO group peptidase (beta-lactamase class C family)